MLIGMGGLIVGNGYFKANISTIVGKLYETVILVVILVSLSSTSASTSEPFWQRQWSLL
jgi:hypothetical protein